MSAKKLSKFDNLKTGMDILPYEGDDEIDALLESGEITLEQSKKIRFLKYLAQNRYNLTNTLRELGIPRYKHDEWIQKDKTYREAHRTLMRHKYEDLSDLAYDSAFLGSEGMIKFVLQTQHRDQGWGKEASLNVNVGGKINFEVVKPEIPERIRLGLAATIQDEDS